ncbi:M15 family metallopeptidase [soil metagenome]
MKIALPLIIFLFSMPMTTYEDPSLPKGFVYIKEVIPDVVLDVRYAGNDNFIGKPITGYKEPKVILSRPAAAALQKVQKDLKSMGYCLKIFDGYRPQRAVNHFIAWAKVPGDTLMKRKYYPEVDKKNLFNLGYISTRSGHSRGSTVDLTIIDMNTQEEVDMGGAYDFFGDRSHHNYSGITAKQKANRAILKNVMIKHGFKPYTQEWWHYTYQPEPYPDTYFDFEVM